MSVLSYTKTSMESRKVGRNLCGQLILQQSSLPDSDFSFLGLFSVFGTLWFIPHWLCHYKTSDQTPNNQSSACLGVVWTWWLYVQGLCPITLLFSSSTDKTSNWSQAPPSPLTCCFVFYSQESLWPTWTPAWQVTRHQPLSTLVRGNTCWTWSPPAPRSRRLRTHGNNVNSSLLSLLVFVQVPQLW